MIVAVVAPHRSQLDDKNPDFDVKNGSTYNSQRLELLFGGIYDGKGGFCQEEGNVSSILNRGFHGEVESCRKLELKAVRSTLKTLF